MAIIVDIIASVAPQHTVTCSSATDRHAVAARELAGDCLAQRSGAPRHRVLVDVALDGGARRVLDRLGGRKVGESLRQIHAAVLVIQSRHLADDRFGELSRFFRAGEL